MLHKLKILPSQYLALDRYERAFVIASIQVKVESDKKQEKEMKKGAKGKRKK